MNLRLPTTYGSALAIEVSRGNVEIAEVFMENDAYVNLLHDTGYFDSPLRVLAMFLR